MNLEWNVFGKEEKFPNLIYIDLSNNGIQVIRGKSFHHVRNVRTLILDFNKLSIKEEETHPRIFSNFESLAELHLSDAFEDGFDKELDIVLDEIFENR